MSISLIVSLTLFIGVGGLLYLMRRDNQTLGKVQEDNAVLGAQNEALSNRPLTDADFIARLRERAADERKNQRKP